MYARGEEIVLGHSVERLCAEAAAFEPAFREWARTWSLLDGYYVPARYPNALPDGIPADVYTRQAAEEAVRLAGEVVEQITSLLGSG